MMQRAKNDRDLFAATKLGAYHAMRCEEICALRIDQVKRGEDGIRYFEKVGDKTAAANRDVPVRSETDTLVDELIANATGPTCESSCKSLGITRPRGPITGC